MANAWLSTFSFTPVVPKVRAAGATDTIRGGKTLLIHGEQLLWNSALDTDFRQARLPTGWTSTLTGSGTRLKGSTVGTLIRTAPVPSTVLLTRTGTVEAFEASLRLELKRPTKVEGSASLLVGSLRFAVSGSEYVEIRLERRPNLRPGEVAVAPLVALPSGHTTTPIPRVVAGEEFTLRIVRFENLVFLYLGETFLVKTRYFPPFLEGGFSIRVSNNDTTERVETILLDFHLRSQVLINGRLLVDKFDASSQRLVGRVPVATLAEVGTCPIIFFGPWGSLTAPDGFEYTLPRGLDMRNSPTSKLSTYVDTSVKT